MFTQTYTLTVSDVQKSLRNCRKVQQTAKGLTRVSHDSQERKHAVEVSGTRNGARRSSAHSSSYTERIQFWISNYARLYQEYIDTLKVWKDPFSRMCIFAVYLLVCSMREPYSWKQQLWTKQFAVRRICTYSKRSCTDKPTFDSTHIIV